MAPWLGIVKPLSIVCRMSKPVCNSSSTSFLIFRVSSSTSPFMSEIFSSTLVPWSSSLIHSNWFYKEQCNFFLVCSLYIFLKNLASFCSLFLMTSKVLVPYFFIFFILPVSKLTFVKNITHMSKQKISEKNHKISKKKFQKEIPKRGKLCSFFSERQTGVVP